MWILWSKTYLLAICVLYYTEFLSFCTLSPYTPPTDNYRHGPTLGQVYSTRGQFDRGIIMKQQESSTMFKYRLGLEVTELANFPKPIQLAKENNWIFGTIVLLKKKRSYQKRNS